MGKQAMKGSPVKSQGCPELCWDWGRTHKGGCPRCWGLEAAERPSAFRLPAFGRELDNAGESSALEPGWWGSGGIGPRQNRRARLLAAASTYPTCHRLLQRAWGGHLRGWRHLEQAGHRSGDRPALASLQGGARSPLPPPDLLVRRVAAAFSEAQRHLWGQG